MSQGAVCHQSCVLSSCTIRPGAGCSLAGQSCHCGFRASDMNKVMWFLASIFKTEKDAAKFLPASSERSTNCCRTLRNALVVSVCAGGMWLEHQQVTTGVRASTCCRFWAQFLFDLPDLQDLNTLASFLPKYLARDTL